LPTPHHYIISPSSSYDEEEASCWWWLICKKKYLFLEATGVAFGWLVPMVIQQHNNDK